MSRCTPIRLYGPRDLSRIEECAQRPLEAWAERWLVRGCSVGSVAAAPCHGDALSSLPLRCVGQAEGAWLGLACFGDSAGAVSLGLFGAEPAPGEPRGATTDVAEAALHELSTSLFEAFTGRGAGKSTSWIRQTGAATPAASLGEVELCIGLPGGQALCVVMSAAAALSCLGGSSAACAASAGLLTARHVALEETRVRLEAVLAPVELPLAEVLAMREGDVVLFSHRLGEPVILRTPAGKPVGRAALGARGGQRAAHLIDSK